MARKGCSAFSATWPAMRPSASAALAARRAAVQRLPVPAFRVGSQKAPWLVDAATLAQHLESLKAKAQADWEKVRA